MNEQWSTAQILDSVPNVLPAPTAVLPDAEGHLRSCSTMQVVNFLLSRSTMDDLAQFLVLQQFADLHPWQLSIYEVGQDSLLRVLGTFGQGEGKGDLHEKSCLEDSPAGEALRSGLPQANFSLSDGSSLRPLRVVDGESGPQMLWPLLTSRRLCGLIQVRFATEPDAAALHRTLSAVSPPIALLVDLEGTSVLGPSVDPLFSLVGGGASERAGGRALRAVQGGRRRALTMMDHPSFGSTEPGPEDLTQRQREVLQYMSEGMTNGQIARILRFSESTVRQETMAIYRALRVGGRVEAVAYAREIGLLPTS